MKRMQRPKWRGRRRAKKQAEIALVAEETPGARKAAREMGVAAGKRVRYKGPEGSDRYGTVRSTHVRSVRIEQTAADLLPNGKNIIIRDDEVPYANVLEVLGNGHIAVRAPAKPRVWPPAPKRAEGYKKCDYCGRSIYEVIKTNKGVFALCKDHSKIPGPDEGVAFKFQLGLIYETYRTWPKPKEEV